MLAIKARLGCDVYAEVCVTTNGEARVVQLAPLPPLPELPVLPWASSDATETQLCRGARTKLTRATALEITDYLEIEELLSRVRDFDAGRSGRSLVVLFEDNILRGLMGQTRELWGALRNVGALFSMISRNTPPHLNVTLLVRCVLHAALDTVNGPVSKAWLP